MDIDTHPNPQANPHHRRIDLQSPHDLTYLQDNLARSALQKLDLHFPKLSKPATHISLGNGGNNTDDKREEQQEEEEEEDEEDPMRRNVRELVSEFLTTTWRSAGPNISVNGIDASTLPIPHTATLAPAPALPQSSSSSDPVPTDREGIDFQYAPFDASLQHQLASLHAELESLTAKVSRLRRTAPTQAADAYTAAVVAAMAVDDASHEAAMEGVLGTEPRGLDIQRVKPGWSEDVREIFGRGVEELAGLAGGVKGQGGGGGGGSTLTETVGKAQRARTVAMEME